MNPTAITTTLGELLGVPVDGPAVERMAARADLTEWSVNARGDDRGRLRVTAWYEDLAAAAAIAAATLPGPSLDEALPRTGTAGLGLVCGGGHRWYRLAPILDGSELARAVAAAVPEASEVARELADRFGGWAACTAVGTEETAIGRRRATLYWRLADPTALFRLAQELGLPPEGSLATFVAGFLGLRQDAPAPMPQAWIARSVGEGGGWKAYAFLRRNPLRPPDGVVLDAIGADAPLRAAVTRLGELAPPVPLKRFTVGVVQLVGLRLAPGGGWTLYMGPR